MVPTPLLELCRLQPFELGDRMCIGDPAVAAANAAAFPEDPTGFEAFVNHFHLHALDLSDQVPQFRHLQDAAEILVACWAVRLLPLLRGRFVLFFAGGPSVNDFSVRFHVDRGPHDSWIDLTESAFLRENNMSVWRFGADGLLALRAGQK